MTNRALWKKCITESQWLLAGCGIVIFAVCWLRIWIVSQMDTSRFKKILDLLPEDWERFSPVEIDWLITYTGRISITWDEPLVFLCVAIWAIARGSDCVSGEIDRGTMEMLLAQPVSRLNVLATHSAVTIAGIVLLVTLSWLGVFAGIQTNQVSEEVQPEWRMPGLGYRVPIPWAEAETTKSPMSSKVEPSVFVPACANLLALGLFLGGLSTLMSSWDRYRWRTIGIVIGVFIIQLVIKVAGLASDNLAWMLNLSVLTGYEPEAVTKIAYEHPQCSWHLMLYDEQGQFKSWGPLGFHLPAAILGITGYIGAAVIFCRRDLPAPI